MSSSMILIPYDHLYTYEQAAINNSYNTIKLFVVLRVFNIWSYSKRVVLTFHVIIERTLITPSDAPKATRGVSPAADLERNSMLPRQDLFREIGTRNITQKKTNELASNN